jgi:hypothetical protein
VLGFVTGGPMEGRPFVLRRDLTLESEVRFVVVGVLVRGVVAAELPLDVTCFVGDFVGDLSYTVSRETT